MITLKNCILCIKNDITLLAYEKYRTKIFAQLSKSYYKFCLLIPLIFVIFSFHITSFVLI